MFNYSNTWPLVIKTGATIITFLIQNTRNRDTIAIHWILDELIAPPGAPITSGGFWKF